MSKREAKKLMTNSNLIDKKTILFFKKIFFVIYKKWIIQLILKNGFKKGIWKRRKIFTLGLIWSTAGLSLSYYFSFLLLAFFLRMSSILFFRQCLPSQIFTYYQIGPLKRYHLSLLFFYEITTFSLMRASGVYLTLKLLSAALSRGRRLFQG